MDVVYSHEPLTPSLIDKIEPLLAEYYVHTVAKSDIPPYDFDWDAYLRLQDLGMMTVTSACIDTELVGFALYIRTHLPHHKTKYVAECDTISTSMHHRGLGIGRRLYEFTEDVLRSQGVEVVINRYRECYDTRPMFEGLGFKQIERVYMKEL